MICLSLGAFAQDEFFPGWYLQLQGGAGHTVGETSFTKLISPEAALSLGYQFTPAFSLRGNVAGWQGKGATITNTVDVYKFNYLQGALDAVFDLRNAFGGYKDRVFNPYFFIGAGANYAFNNGVDPAKLPVNNNYWADKSVSPVGRAGLGLDFKVSDGLSLGIEAVENVLNDNFNSKEGDVVDHQINALVGLKYQFGAAKRRAAEAAALAAAEAAAAKAAADKAAAEL
ncbi:MAG: OmpA family protein, partial [Bacteroidales bacterium]|nr:OmpA family protein [Bacteroidales bacterium]